MEEKKLSIIEAILFTMGEAVAIEKIANALEVSDKEAIELIEKLKEYYETSNRGLCIVELDGKYQMSTKKDMYPYLIKVVKQPQKQVLTDVLLETLSIIAYKQPVTKSEVEFIRGVSSEHAMNKLIAYGLIEEVGRLDAPGRPMLFGTTEEFLRNFGVHSLDELPNIKEEQIEAFKRQVEQEVQLKMDI